MKNHGDDQGQFCRWNPGAQAGEGTSFSAARKVLFFLSGILARLKPRPGSKLVRRRAGWRLNPGNFKLRLAKNL
jgi:hypothetical protein